MGLQIWVRFAQKAGHVNNSLSWPVDLKYDRGELEVYWPMSENICHKGQGAFPRCYGISRSSAAGAKGQLR
jgi:hypothetical protein